MTQLNVTELDFAKIKPSIKDYISDQDEFRDYNFQGSVINLLIDMLAYHTYQNSFYTSMIGNEMFLDSAQLRDSVVSRAKMLNYIPSTVRSSKTNRNFRSIFAKPNIRRKHIVSSKIHFTKRKY